MSLGSLSTEALEAARIDDIISDRAPAVRVNTPISELWERVLEQNFVPVVDDRDMFVGIVTRRSVMAYLMDQKKRARDANTDWDGGISAG